MLHANLSAFESLPDSALIRENYILGTTSRSVSRASQKMALEEEPSINKPIKDDLLSKRIWPPIVQVSRSTWRRWVKAGNAPKPIKLSVGVVAWRVGDLREWLRKTSV